MPQVGAGTSVAAVIMVAAVTLAAAAAAAATLAAAAVGSECMCRNHWHLTYYAVLPSFNAPSLLLWVLPELLGPGDTYKQKLPSFVPW